MHSFQVDREAIELEGYTAYHATKCSYKWETNPYKGTSVNWVAYWWQCGFQRGYAEDNPAKEAQKDTTYNFRNEGESSQHDRYFGRGL